MKRALLTFLLLFLAAMAIFPPAAWAENGAGGVSQATAPYSSNAAGTTDVSVSKRAGPNGGRSPAYSPDGKMIAFLSSTLHTPLDLWIMNADGSGKRRLTTRGVSHFRWSGDGKSIVFAARRKGYEEVMRIRVDGAGPEERIPGIPPNSGVPVESPDGKLFAFTAPGEMQNVRDLWIGTSDGTRIEPVTEKIGVRSIFWGPDGRKLYYEAGKTYGVGIWEIDLSSMESRPLLNKYIGAPAYSEKAGRVAFPYPTNPGEFEVHTMKLDGSGVMTYKAPRLAGRWLAWDAEGLGVYYLGQDIETVASDNSVASADNTSTVKTDKQNGKRSAPHETRKPGVKAFGVNALWRLDLASGSEKRISPPELHLSDFSLSPGGKEMALAGVSEKSSSADLFRLDLSSGAPGTLAKSRHSAWMPVPSPDATRIAFFTNEGTLDTLKVVNIDGEEVASYPGFALEGDTRLFWLPRSEGLLVFSGRGLHAFTERGPVVFPQKDDLRSYLYADASIHDDKVLISAIPRYGETPGLYMLEASDNTFKLTDLRYPPAPEIAAELYLQPRWSPDGGKVAFTDGVDVWTMKSDGTGRVRITNNAERNKEGKEKSAQASYPFWSVNGKRIGYILTVYDGKKVVREMIVSNADGSGPAKLHSEEVDSQFQVFQPEYTHQPFFDATDEKVIFTALHRGVPNIFAVEAAGGEPKALTEKGAIYPALLPEEGVIVYVSLEGNDERLFIMNTDGTEKRPLVIGKKGKDAADPPSK